MVTLAERVSLHAREAEAVWGRAYPLFSAVVADRGFKVGAEIGVAFGGLSEALLTHAGVERLYGVDPYRHMYDYDDPFNLPQAVFDQVYRFATGRLARFGERYHHVRKPSVEAAVEVPGPLGFVYIDALHTYQGVWEDLCTWFPKVRDGGVIGGHDYGHPDHPGVQQAVDRFFGRFGWRIHPEGEGVWWVEKQPLGVSFFMPAYNCAGTVRESVESIMDGSFSPGDELVIVNDGSTDNTEGVLNALESKYPGIRVISHLRNKGGGAARNTAVENAQNRLLFCLDSDNVLVSGSIAKLKDYLLSSGADAASLQELHCFADDKSRVTSKWTFRRGLITLADCLAGGTTPASSGNYMFTKESWARAGGYPEFAGALDTWGFGVRQLATGCKMVVMPTSYYYHRSGHESYWIRDSRARNISLTALEILLPFLDMLDEKDVEYITSPRGQYHWFADLQRHPIRLRTGETGRTGVRLEGNRRRIHRLGKLQKQSLLLIRRIHHLHKRWIRPIVDWRQVQRALCGYRWYVANWREYARMLHGERLHFLNSYPCLFDRTLTTPFDIHYLYEDIWAFKAILASGTSSHVDVGSRATFVGMLTAITKVTSVGIRPLVVNLENFDSQSGSILALPFRDNSVASLSCLHVAEHIGLGRYGDPLDAKGTEKATRELARVLAPGGNLYFSVPVGKPRVCFNAHRIHSPAQVLEYFYDLTLVGFSGVDDRGTFREGIEPSELAGTSYACGLFHFTKEP